MTKIETVELTAPSAWASYIINGDASGITDAEQDAADQFLGTVDGECVDVSGEEFMTYHDARQFAPYAADCSTYTFVLYTIGR